MRSSFGPMGFVLSHPCAEKHAHGWGTGHVVLKGHGFSRAENVPDINAALAAEGTQMDRFAFPQGLKPSGRFALLAARLEPCPFNTDDTVAFGLIAVALEGSACR